MEKSQSIVNIAKALSQFQAKIGKVTKDATNPFFNSKYATLSNILETIKMPLIDSGLSFTQFPTGQNGLTTVLMHSDSGEYMQTDYFMNPSKSDPQAQGSAISYMRRYALSAVLGLNIDEDDDANAATHGASTPAAVAKAEAKATASDKPWLNEDSKVYEKIITRLKNKTTTLDQIAQHFKLSKQVRASLQTIINSVSYSDN